MSGEQQSGGGGRPPVATARRARFSAIWLIPIIAAVAAAFLGWRAIGQLGPLITISFQSADGLTAGQTQLKHKNVALGTVENIHLADDMRTVRVRVRMQQDAAKILTDHARFWVVRPRLSGSNISGLETLVSGAYIAVDPGAPGGHVTHEFTGLENPPGVRSDEPGRTYTLMTGSVASLGPGSPLFYRGVNVGEVLGYRMPANGIGAIPVQAFVRDPYSNYVRVDTRFWNASGVDVSFGGGGLHVELQSLQAVLSGGVAFGLPADQRGVEQPVAPNNALFKLYDSKEDADNAGYRRRIDFATYMQNSVKGLVVGSEVDLYGIQIGEVTDIKLELDAKTGQARVRVGMEIQPERAFSAAMEGGEKPEEIAQHLVDSGMRAQLSSASFITGSSLIEFAFVPNAKPATVTEEGSTIILPSEKGGISGITDSLSDVAAKLDALPLAQIADHLDTLLAGASDRVNSADTKNAIRDLSGTLRSIQHLADHANSGLTPLLQRLPGMTEELQATLVHANQLLSSYNGNSDFGASLNQTLLQLNDMARSLRLLADYVGRHPNSILFGRTPPVGHQ